MLFCSYNVQYGKGKDGRYDLARIAAEVAGADVVALQEVERFWTRSGDLDQEAELGALLPEYYRVYGAGVDYDASRIGAGGRIEQRRRQFGNMLLARRPILMARNHLLPKYASLGPLSIQRAALEGVIDTAAGPLRIYSLHLTHLAAETRLPQVERLLEIHARAPLEGAAITGEGMPEWRVDVPGEAGLPRAAILMGDFNFTPASREYRRLAGPVSEYGGLMVNPEGFVDAWVASGHDEGAGATSEVQGEPARLDYFFVSAALRERILRVWIDADAQGSDHQPLWMEIDL